MIPKPPQQPTAIAVDVEEAARLIAVSRGSIRKLIKDKKIFAYKLGNRFLVPVAELQRFVNGEERKTA